MHSEETREKLYEMIKEGKSLIHTDMYGIMTLPILPFTLDSILPDNLHCVMAVERKLVSGEH